LYINDEKLQAAGLFGHVNNSGTVKNLGVVNVNIVGGKYHIGGVVGYLRASFSYGASSVINCYSTGKIRGEKMVGGVVGKLYSFSDDVRVINCYSSATVNGDWNIGGVVGSLDVLGNNGNSSVINSYSTGAVSGKSMSIGGVAGEVNKRCYIANSYSTSIVNGDAHVGGVAGSVKGRITNSYSTGAVSGNSTSIGGIAGNVTGRIINCAALSPSIHTKYKENRVAKKKAKRSVALSGMTDNHSAPWSNIGPNKPDGASLTASEIRSDGTIGKRFTRKNGWTTQDGRLPGLNGQTVEMPAHLK
jgi:hypothetical protein